MVTLILERKYKRKLEKKTEEEGFKQILEKCVLQRSSISLMLSTEAVCNCQLHFCFVLEVLKNVRIKTLPCGAPILQSSFFQLSSNNEVFLGVLFESQCNFAVS
jgi:hypothetical protein